MNGKHVHTWYFGKFLCHNNPAEFEEKIILHTIVQILILVIVRQNHGDLSLN